MEGPTATALFWTIMEAPQRFKVFPHYTRRALSISEGILRIHDQLYTLCLWLLLQLVVYIVSIPVRLF